MKGNGFHRWAAVGVLLSLTALCGCEGKSGEPAEPPSAATEEVPGEEAPTESPTAKAPAARDATSAEPSAIGEPGRASDGPNPMRNVYFGEQHMHTRNSFDAFTIGVGQTCEQAYRFAMGEEVTLSTTGEKMKRRTPYDFVAITDHSEYYGVLKDFKDPKSELSKSDFAKKVVAGLTDPAKGADAVTTLIGSLVTNTPLREYVTPELRVGNWQKFIETADKFNQPGKFTTPELHRAAWPSRLR